MKRPEFLETKRTPRYSLRKLNVGVASVLLGVTIFGINFTDHSVKAATKAANPVESVRIPNDPPTGNLQQASAAVLKPAEQTSTTEKVQQSSASNDATEEVQQNSASKNVTANNSAEAATTSQSLPKTKGSAHTYIRSLAAKNLLAMNLLALPDTDGNAAGTPGTGDRSAAVTVNPDNINTQPAKENQELANKHNLTSSDNYSSNIYKGKDGKYYKIVTIYGNDYVYHAADIQANGTAFGQWATKAEDTKNNINISKEDLGNGKTRWTVVFFPHKGLQNVGSNLSGLQSAKFGIALTKDYQIVGDVDMDITTDPNQTFVAHTFKDNSNSSTDITVSNPSPEVKFSFNPNTDVDPNTGLINSKTMPAYNNQYLQGPYYFNTDAYAGRRNLWQTYFEDGVEYNNAYDVRIPYLGGNHDFHLNNFEIKNKTGVDGAKQKDKIIYDTLGYRLNSKNANPNGVFSSDNFNQAMEFKSQGVTDQSQFSSYKISFTTQHTDSYEVELTTGPKNQQFSGIAANIYSFQNKYYNMFSSLYGEQRALNPADAAHPAPLNPKDIIPNWQIGDEAKTPKVPSTKEPVANTSHLTDGEKAKVQKNVEDANKDENGKSTLPDGTTVTVGDDGTATVTYPDKTTDTIQGSDLVRPATDAEKTTPKVPSTKEPVANTSHLTDGEKAKVQKNVEDANKDENGKSTLPDGTTVTVGDDGTATVTYPDKTTDTIQGSDLVRPATDAEKTTPKVPSTKEPVANTSHLTDGEKAKVQKNVEDANKDENGKSTLPDGTTVTVGDDGTATVTYPDKTTDTIQGSDLVRPATDAEKTTPKVPSTKEPVANTSHLTDGEKAKVQKNVEDANKDENGKSTLPDGTTVTVGDDGTATVTYPDKTTDTIQGSDLVRPATDAEKTTPKVPSTKEPVANTSHLTDGEKAKVQKNVEDANKDENGKSTLPDGTTVTVGDDGTATVTYPDKTTDTIQGSDLVRPATDAEKTTPKVPSTKEPVANTSHLTDGEKAKVQKNVEDANKDENGKSTLPDGTTVTVGDDGTATVTYPDKTTDTIQGSDLVRPATDAEKTTPKVPSTKEPVANTSHLTDGEKAKVQKNVEDANKDENGKSTLPDGTTVTVGDDGTATVTYPDKTTDTIQGSDLVRPATDAEKTTPKVPSTKEPVANTSHLTDGEKAKVQKNVEDANKDENGKSTLPDGTTVTVGDDGTATVTYPDKTTDTIQGSDLVRPATDAEKTTPKVPSTKEPVANTSHLTDGEKAKVQKNVEDANKDENGKSTLPDGTTVTVGDDGTATVTYPDKTTDTIQGSDLVRPATDAEKTTPKVPSTKEPVANTSHLTDGEKAKVQKNVEDANKDENGKSTLPDGTTVTVGDDGTATVTYPDKTTDTIQGSDLVRPAIPRRH
ncbi:LEA family epithelial adhesin [Limosilactobacillus reuteri]|uniref:LEA family epithelial adhesin n=1 Tax=Limosilactobacillus reuteri TaxID=1598 RepID=UPI003D8142DC